jgi:DNA-binding NarL/FixJ family response regulator
MIRIIIMHETEVVCNALANLLNEEVDLTIVGLTCTPDETAQQIHQTPCDLVLLDGSQPNTGFLSFIQEITQSGEGSPKVLVMGLPDQIQTVLRVLQAGASAYALQEASSDELIRQIRNLCEDRVTLSPEVAFALIQQVQSSQRASNSAPSADDAARSLTKEAHPELTPREQEVLHLLQKRCTNREIAQLLTIELGTVKNHVHSILQKLNVDSRRAAAEVTKERLAPPL